MHSYIQLEFLPCPHFPVLCTGHLCLRIDLVYRYTWPYYVLPLIANYERAEGRIELIYHLLQKILLLGIYFNITKTVEAERPIACDCLDDSTMYI